MRFLKYGLLVPEVNCRITVSASHKSLYIVTGVSPLFKVIFLAVSKTSAIAHSPVSRTSLFFPKNSLVLFQLLKSLSLQQTAASTFPWASLDPFVQITIPDRVYGKKGKRIFLLQEVKKPVNPYKKTHVS